MMHYKVRKKLFDLFQVNSPSLSLLSCFGDGSLLIIGGGGTGGNRVCVYLAGDRAIVSDTGGL